MSVSYKQLKKGKAILPFWGDEYNYSVGRDLLGLQTASLSTYTTLVPGVTNLTFRIRYYGFYCWLLDQYAQKVGINDHRKQREFIRRAEYQLACLIMHEDSKILRVSGSNFALSKINKLNNAPFISLEEGADLKKDKVVYFKNPIGAFGQYYVGAMKTLGLIFFKGDNHTMFVCSYQQQASYITGKRLADAFSKDIPEEIQDLFLENIEKGILKKSDIKKLFDCFSLINISVNSEEWNLYQQILMQKDEPHLEQNQTFRKETILTILKDIDQYQDTRSNRQFIEASYQQKQFKEHSFSQTITGWYFYELNEYWHYANEMMFYSILERLRDQARPLHGLLHQLTEGILQELSSTQYFKENISFSEHTTLDVLFFEENEILLSELELAHFSKNKTLEEIATQSFLLIIKLIRKNQSYFDELKNWCIRFNINTSNNDVITSLQSIYNQKDLSIKEVIKNILQQFVINQHLLIAYSKMGTSTQNTLKFTYENEMLHFLDIVEPTWTSPRMNTTWLILQDLHLIEKNEDKIYHLTDNGQTFLNTYS